MKLGTRGSDLALWQARLVRASLLDAAGIEPEIVIIKTQGDKDQVATFDKMEGKGFFTKEIEAALLDRSVDLAVHSLKDLQTTMPGGLALGAVLKRADRRDMILIRPEAADPSRTLGVKEGATIGTSSARRVAQLRFLRPDLNIVALRGNVPTRVQRLREGRFDAILIAAAGLDRLELPLDGLVTQRLPEALFVPAPGQGALAIQIREGDSATQSAVERLHNEELAGIVWLEREILRRMDGGCQLPLGTCADRTPEGIRLQVFLKQPTRESPLRFVVAGHDKSEIADAALARINRASAPPDKVNVWITREYDKAGEFINALDPARFKTEALSVHAMIEAGDPQQQSASLKNLTAYDWVLFTSQKTVARFAALLKQHGASFQSGQRLAAVGSRTAKAMRDQGWRVDFISEVADGKSFGEAMRARLRDTNARILFPCGAKASNDLEDSIGGSGLDFERLVCYDTVESPSLAPQLERLAEPHLIVFTSPSAVDILLSRRRATRNTTVVSIGPATTDRLLSHGFPIVWETVDRSMTGLAAEVNSGLSAD
ncbi:MAG: hydroxymethylbilane synthase [Candidatus Zixiibacteriota bacterium]